MSLMIFNVRSIDVPLFFCFLFFCFLFIQAIHAISMQFYFSEPPRLCVTNSLGMNEIIQCSMCVTVDLFEECHMATALQNTGTWSQFVAWWCESHDPCSLLGELGVGWYLGQIAKCRNDCQKGGFMDPSVHKMQGEILSILNPSVHTFTMFPLIRKCNEVIRQESSRCNWQEIAKPCWWMDAWEGGRTDGCCGWPMAPGLLIKTWRLRSKEDELFLYPLSPLSHCEHRSVNTLDGSKKAKLTCLHKPSMIFIREVMERTHSLKGSCCRALA